MRLAEYLTANDLTPAEFAGQLGVTPEAVRLWRRGLRIPRRDMMERIRSITEGSVGPVDFFGAA